MSNSWKILKVLKFNVAKIRQLDMLHFLPLFLEVIKIGWGLESLLILKPFFFALFSGFSSYVFDIEYHGWVYLVIQGEE